MSVSLALAGLLLAQTAPSAPPPVVTEDESVVVTGERVTSDTVQRFVRELVRQPFNGGYPVWQDKLCPAVFGLKAPTAARVEARMRLVMEAVGLETKTGCNEPNAILIVAPDKPVFMRVLARQSNLYYLAGQNLFRRQQIVNDPSPAVAWHMGGPPTTKMGGDGFEVLVTGETSDRMRRPLLPTFIAAFVVVDAAAIQGLTVTQLADYAAMRAIMRVEPRHLSGPRAQSILRVIDAPADAEVAAGLTAWDLALLRAVYRSDGFNFRGRYHLEISRRIQRDLKDQARE